MGSTEIPFSPDALMVMRQAYQEASLLRHAYIGTPHLLIALIETEPTRTILQNLGLQKVDGIKPCIENLIGEGSTEELLEGPESYNQTLKEVIGRAIQEAQDDGSDAVTQLHLLRGLFAQDSIDASMFNIWGIPYEAVRAQCAKIVVELNQ